MGIFFNPGNGSFTKDRNYEIYVDKTGLLDYTNSVLGTTDARGVLFREYVRLLQELSPVGFLFENVYGIIGAQGGEAWKEILESFSDVGYKLYYRIVDAADYGVPQHRERLIIVGLKDGEFKCFCCCGDNYL